MTRTLLRGLFAAVALIAVSVAGPAGLAQIAADATNTSAFQGSGLASRTFGGVPGLAYWDSVAKAWKSLPIASFEVNGLAPNGLAKADANGRLSGAAAAASDVAGALGYTPISKSGDTTTGQISQPQSAQPEPSVFLGGVYGWESMATSLNYAQLRAMQTGGIYLHGSATDQTLYGSTNAAISAVIGKATPVIVEISFGGGFQPSFFTSSSWTSTILGNYTPTVAVVNIDNTGFTGAFANPAYSVGYPTQPYSPTSAQIAQGAAGNADVADWPAYVSAGRSGGLKVMAPIVSPNACGTIGPNPPGCASTTASDNASPQVAHPWCLAGTGGVGQPSCIDDGWWTGVKQMAMQGGGVALDAPPGYYLRILPDDVQRTAYIKFDSDVIGWAKANNLWSAYVASPFGSPGTTAATSTYLQDVQTNYYLLATAGALPTAFVVENYETCGPKYNIGSTVTTAAAAGATSAVVSVGTGPAGLSSISQGDTFTLAGQSTVYTATNTVSGSSQTLQFSPALTAAAPANTALTSTPACHASAGSPLGPETTPNTQNAVALWMAQNAKTSLYTGALGPLLAPAAKTVPPMTVNGRSGALLPGYGGLAGAGTGGSQDAMAPYVGTNTAGRGQQNQNQLRGSNIGLPAGLVAQGQDANIGQIVAPKGGGSLSGSVPDNTAAGGALPGVFATDWQRARSAATQVASGTYATIGGGTSNGATAQAATVAGGNANVAAGNSSTVGGGTANQAVGNNSAVAGGNGNSASIDFSSVGGGNNNKASALYAAVGGGNGNTASGQFSTIAGGNSNTASGLQSTVTGGQTNTASGQLSRVGGLQANDFGRYGCDVFSSGNLGGRASQHVLCLLRGASSSTSPLRLTADGLAAGASNCFNLQPGTVLSFSVTLSMRDGFANSFSWSLPLAQLRQDGGPSATTYAQGSVSPQSITQGSAAAPAVALSADTTNGCLSLVVTPANSDASSWSATIRGTEQQ